MYIGIGSIALVATLVLSQVAYAENTIPPNPLAARRYKVVYGEDYRIDYYAATPEAQRAADATVALVLGENLEAGAGGRILRL